MSKLRNSHIFSKRKGRDFWKCCGIIYLLVFYNKCTHLFFAFCIYILLFICFFIFFYICILHNLFKYSSCSCTTFIQNNNFISLCGFAFAISGLRGISFDITCHPKKKKQKIHFVFVKKKKTLQLLSPYWVRSVLVFVFQVFKFMF